MQLLDAAIKNSHEGHAVQYSRRLSNADINGQTPVATLSYILHCAMLLALSSMEVYIIALLDCVKATHKSRLT